MLTFIQKIKRFYYDLPVNSKLNVTNIIIIVIFMIMLAFLATSVSSNIIIDKSVGYSEQDLAVVSKSIDSLLNQVEYLSKLTATDSNVQSILKIPKTDTLSLLEKRVDAIGSLDSMVGQRDIISSELLFTKNGAVVTSSYIDPDKLLVNNNGFIRNFNDIGLSKGEVTWLDTHHVGYYLVGDSTDCISLLRVVMNNSTGEEAGYLVIDVDQKIISKLFLNSSDKNKGINFIINREGSIVCSSDEKSLYRSISNEGYFKMLINNENGKIVKVGKQNFLLTSLNYKRLNWYIVGLTPLDSITKESQKVTKLTFAVGFICILLAIIFSVFNSRAITKPIKSLSKDMISAGQGDMEVRAVILGNDEIGQLSKSFNTMIGRISALMDKVYYEQKQKRSFELLALQSQINPHFLYNTLESICALANKNRNSDVIKMVKALAMFYRTALSSGRNVITIKEEIDNIRYYLQIQEIRYFDKFDYSFEIDEEILNNSIVKLSLQPLIENAIYHGLREKTGKGMIWIRGKQEGDTIKIMVEDNGIGFEENLSELILNGDRQVKGKKSFGLKNVNDRIKLYFGEKFGLSIYSKPGIGTKVEVSLPYVAHSM